jgi:hypothetical protein
MSGNTIGSLAFAATALVAYFLFFKNLRSFVQLKKSGRVTIGRVIGAPESEDSCSLVVVFQDEIGKSHVVYSKSGNSDWSNLVGKEVRVCYDPSSPENARILNDVRNQLIVAAFLSVAFTIGAVLIKFVISV